MINLKGKQGTKTRGTNNRAGTRIIREVDFNSTTSTIFESINRMNTLNFHVRDSQDRSKQIHTICCL